MDRHIYKYSVRTSFFDLVTSPAEITKDSDDKGNPTISWVDSKDITTSWIYDDESQRDNDFEVITSLRYKLMD